MDVSWGPQEQIWHLTEHCRACQKGKAWQEHCSEKNSRTWLWASALLVYRGPWISSDSCPSSSHPEPICRVTLSPHQPQPTPPQWPHLLPCIRKRFLIWYSSWFISFWWGKFYFKFIPIFHLQSQEFYNTFYLEIISDLKKNYKNIEIIPTYPSPSFPKCKTFITLYHFLTLPFFAYMLTLCEWKSLSHVWFFATLWTIQSMEFSRLEKWSG